jgi:outer membrane protein assembly factor BamB/precorrin-6B methylase 2
MCRVLSSLAIALTLSIHPFLWGQETAQETAVAEEAKNAREPDVIFVPTPQDVVDKMLDLAKVKQTDVLYDLGCGDGRIVVTAAKKYACKATGYDIDPQRIKESLENVATNKVEKLVEIKQEDIFKLDLSKANVITLYLLSSLNEKLIPQLEKLGPGSRIVSHDFRMKGVKPDTVVRLTSKDDNREHKIFLWTTPLKKRMKGKKDRSQEKVSVQDSTEYWPQWRGPLANGVAPQGNPPTTWSEQKNIKWKVKLPGEGSASPIVWSDKVFILAAVATERKGKPTELESERVQRPNRPSAARPEGPPRGARAGRPRRIPPQRGGSPGRGRPGGRGRGGFSMSSPAPTVYYRFDVLCLDRNTGRILWRQTAREEVPHQGHHRDGTYASFSPVTDGAHVYAYFGSQGLHCFDLNGNRKWEKDLGKMDVIMRFGEGGAPALHGDRLLVNFDHQGDSFLTAIDKRTGETIWKVDRDEATSWSTPLVVDVNGKTQVVVNATQRVRGYDLESGKVLWECGGQTRNVIPSPVTGFGMVFVTSGFRGSALQAIELGRQGDLTETDAIRWHVDRGTPYVSSPLLYGDKIYLFSGNNAILSCYQAETGESNFVQSRLNGLKGVYASPVGAAGRIYLVGRSGTTQVIKQSTTLDVLATNSLDEGIDASPAVVGKELFLRSKQSLYCIAEE